MLSLSLGEILVGYAVFHFSVFAEDRDAVCSDFKIENVYAAGKKPNRESPGRFVVKSAESLPLEISKFPTYVDFCYRTTLVSAWARCYNHVTVPSILKLDLTTTDVEISFTDENCTSVDCTPDDLRELFRTDDPRCSSEVEKRGILPICRSFSADDPRCFFRGHNYFFRPVTKTKGMTLNRLGETCSKILPIAKPVALETSQEVNFIRNLIRDYPSFILTSGIKVNDSNKAFWFLWNFETDGKSIPPRDFQILVLSAGDPITYWLNSSSLPGEALILCETDPETENRNLSIAEECCSKDDFGNVTAAPIGEGCPSNFFLDACECETFCNVGLNGSCLWPRKNETCCFEKTCFDVDFTGKIWWGCPGKVARIEVTCPESFPVRKAEATWYCDENGDFVGFPDYEKCGEIHGGWNSTPPSPCDREPCSPDWLSDVEEMIEAGNDSLTIMNTINDHSKNDSRTGFGEIIDVTSKCVDLFHRQLSKNGSVYMFDDFAKSYYSFLGNILTDTAVWSDVVLNNRLNYTKKILDMTEQVAFSRLNVVAEVSGYANNNTVYDGFGGLCFFVSYGTDPVGSKFSGNNGSWSLEIKEVNGRIKNDFAATGLILENALGPLMFPKGNGTSDKMINAPIITFSLATKTKDSILEYKNVTVDLSFKHTNKSRYPSTKLIRRRLHESEVPSPVFGSSECYFYGSSDWDPDGCRVVSRTERETSCRCVHLSTISVLMDVHDYVPEPTLEMISMISSGASIVSLMLTLMVFFGFESIKSERTTIGKHLCFCLLIGHVMLLTVMDKKFFYLSDEACSIVAVVLHYVFTAAFFWMAVEGHHLYRLVVVVFESDVDYKTRYLLVGYGIPVLVVGLTELVAVLSDDQAYGQDELCWLQTPAYVWAFTGPVIAITTFNLFVLIVTMKLAVVAKSVDGKYNLNSVKLWLKGWSSLSTLLGVTWLVGLGYIQYNFFFVYAFVLLNGFQGLFIFLFRCVLNDQVRGAFVKQYRTRTSQYEDSKTIQVNTTKSMTRFGQDKSGSVTTLHERRKSSGSSSVDYDSVADRESTSPKKSVSSQILQKIQMQSKRKAKKDRDPEGRPEDGSLPTYSECFPSREPPEETLPPASGLVADFPNRYPPIEEEPDSSDDGRIDNAKQNKY